MTLVEAAGLAGDPETGTGGRGGRGGGEGTGATWGWPATCQPPLSGVDSVVFTLLMVPLGTP